MSEPKKIERLPTARLTPELLLNMRAEYGKELKQVAIVMEWEDGSMSVDYTHMGPGTLLVFAKLLEGQAEDLMFGGAP